MKKMFWRFGFAAVLGLASVATSINAQEEDQEAIVIINRDGEEVKSSSELRIQEQDDSKGSRKAGIRAEVKGDKVIIIGADGKTREIDIADAKSVAIQQSVNSINKDGKQKSVTRGRAIIVGPDGKRHEIELDGPINLKSGGLSGGLILNELNGLKDLPEGLFSNFEDIDQLRLRNGFPGHIVVGSTNVGKYMIGILCKPVPESLRAHLDLENEIGLLVDSVTEDQPASKSGIQKHDILIMANGKELTSNKDLVATIQTSGKADESLEVTALRKGKELTIKVKPMERPKTNGAPMTFEFKEMGPGMIFGNRMKGGKTMEFRDMPEFNEIQRRMESQLEEMRLQMEMMDRQMKQLPKFQRQSDKTDGEDTSP